MLSKASGSRVNVSQTVIYGCQVGLIADSGIFATCLLSAWQTDRSVPRSTKPGPSRRAPLWRGERGAARRTVVIAEGTARRAAHPSGQEGGSSLGSKPRCRGWAPSCVIAWVWVPCGCSSHAGAARARHDGVNPTHVNVGEPSPRLHFQAQAHNGIFPPSADPSRRHSLGPAAFSTEAARLQCAHLRLGPSLAASRGEGVVLWSPRPQAAGW